MRLDVPLIRQKKDSVDCGLAGLSMLMKYYGIDKSISELKKSIKTYEGIGTYAPQLGKYLIENGFKVEIVTMNPYLFTKKFKNKPKKELIKYFEEFYKKNKKESFKEPSRFFKEFLEAGGKLNLRIPDIDDIKKEISNKRPLGALITSNFLLYDKPSFNFHFNIITGIDNKFIYVNDSLPDKRGGKHKYKINDFMYAIYASAHGDLDNASIIKIKKQN
jgi:hypothetical protein